MIRLKRDISAIEDRKRGSARDIGDTVQLPTSQDGSAPTSQAGGRRHLPAATDDEAMRCVEQGKPVLGTKVERVLGNIIFTSKRPGSGTAQVDCGQVVQSF